jgi:hypothetical protein
VPGDECRPDPFFVQHTPGSDGSGENRWLSIFRETQLVLGTFETKLRELRSQGVVGFFECLLGNSVTASKVFAHADGLRTLAGKQEADWQ